MDPTPVGPGVLPAPGASPNPITETPPLGLPALPTALPNAAPLPSPTQPPTAPAPTTCAQPTQEIKTIEITNGANLLNTIDGENVSLNENTSTGAVTFDLPPSANLKGNSMNDMESLSYSQLV